MKKIGLLSMQKVCNYGSFLQAFALKKTIEQLGHQCEFVDIEQGNILNEYKRTPLLYIQKIIERFCKFDVLTRIKYTKLFLNRFNSEFFDLLEANKHTIKQFDTVVIGSDEVFHFAQKTTWGYTPQLYGRVKNTNKVISYAGSFGSTTIDKIAKHNLEQEIAEALSSMTAISVRDTNSAEIVTQLTGTTPTINVDPVLMFDYMPYVKEVNRKDYIIIYTYPNRIKCKTEIDAIVAFARKHNKKLISIGFYFSWCDETVVPTPFEVLGYIKAADYIVTDTFHGTVMSLKLNRKFVSIIRESNKQKMTSLLTQFNLSNRIVENTNELEQILIKEIDYTVTNKVLLEERERSLQYLNDNL